MQLVNRGSQAAQLTPAGEYLAEHVLHAEGVLAQAALGLRRFARITPAVLHVAASGTPGNYLLPRIMAVCQRAHAGVRVDLSLGTSSVAIDAVRTHRAELGVVGGLAAFEELEAEPIYKDEIVLIGARALAERQYTPRDLREFTWLTREPGSSTRHLVEAACEDLGIRPSAQIALPSWEAIKQAVAAGYGIAACSQLAIEPELKSGILCLLDAPSWRVGRTISLIRIANVELSEVARWFRETMISELRPRS